MVAAGLAGVTVGIGLVAWQSMRCTLSGRLLAGLVLLGPAAIAAVGLALLLDGPVAALAAPTAGTLLGFAVASRSDGGDSGTEADDDPPWWPSFERGLRRYEQTHRPAQRR